MLCSPVVWCLCPEVNTPYLKKDDLYFHFISLLPTTPTMARKRRVPEVLWRLFNNRAHTLVDTILALIPPTPVTVADCRCQGQRCLGCSGDQAMSFILRPEDPSDYRRLLSRCFVVVSPDAPPLHAFDPLRRWSQLEIVKKSIEMILCEQPSSSNLICWSYDKENQSSAIVDLLMSSAWVLLLTRVGDTLMMHLLKYTSLFLPLPKNKHHQITGFPISNLSLKLSRHIPDSKSQHHATAHGKRRKRIERVASMPGEQLRACSFGFEHSSNSYGSVDIDGPIYVSEEELSLKKPEESSKPNIAPSRKRTRQYRWQRQRKRRLFPIHETRSLVMACKGDLTNSNNISRGCQNGFCMSSGQCDENNISHCFCCLVFRNIPKLTKNAEIDRRSIFYRLESSSSMLPQKHILYTMKPNESGAAVLFKNVFGILEIDETFQSVKCYHSKTSCLLRSDCLYHSLIQLLKSLIRKTQSCRYLRLLDKHCSMTSFYEGTSKGTGATYEESDAWAKVSVRGCSGAQTEGTAFHGDNASNNKMVSEATFDQLEPSKSYCMKKQVVSFIWAICRRIVPLQLLGTPSNWRILRKNISKFIKLRKFEKFSLKQCLHKLKLSKFLLLSNKHFSWNLSFDGMKHTKGTCVHKRKGCVEFAITDVVRQTIFECWIFWFFARLVAPLVQANFYVTESEHEKQEVLYYRKSTWEKLMREARKYLKDQRYHQLNYASARKLLENRSFGFSKVRLRPKLNGFRVLANLQASSRMLLSLPRRIQSNHYLQKSAFCNLRSIKYESFKSVNSVLRDLHVVLKGIHSKEPHKLGSSVFDYNDIHRKLVPFLFPLKNGLVTMPGVFIVVSDVSKAFDSVNQDKLLSIMEDVILQDEYTLEKFIQVICTKKSLKVHQYLSLAPGGIVAESAKITPRLPAHSLDCILVKKASSRKISSEEFNLILKEHVKHNVVQLDNNFYLQRVGIPQGSVLSTLLCSFYYGHMEKNVIFPFLEKACEDISVENDTHGASTSKDCHAEEMLACTSKYILLRFVDDFLFISTSKKQASMFFSRLERGVREYNCVMNKEKYGLNFNINNTQGSQSSRVYVGKDGILHLRWSGLLINCHTLEIQADYTRYLNSRLSSTITVSCQGQVGRKLRAKLRDYLRPKCHPIFYDSNINSGAVVRLNIYQVFLLCAMKFLCYLSDLSTVPRFTPKFYINAIDASLRYMHRLIKRKMYTFETDIAFRPKYDVKRKEILWLGLHAYSCVVKKKQSRYKKLFHILRYKLKAQGKLENISSELKYAVDDTHSSALWSIKY